MTARDDFERRFRAESSPSAAAFMLERDGEGYYEPDVNHDWKEWSAAYAAGQGADTDLMKQSLQALEHCLDWLDPQASAALEASGVVESLADAIRNRKEQG